MKPKKMELEDCTKLLACTENPGVVFPLPADAAPSGIRAGMAGVSGVFASGYLIPKATGDFVAEGEFVVVRRDGDAGKSYRFLLLADESGVHFVGRSKDFDGHHFPPDSGVPVDKLFEHYG